MKYCKQFLCALLVFVLLFGVFSTTVSAEENFTYQAKGEIQWYQNGNLSKSYTYDYSIHDTLVPKDFEDPTFNTSSYFVSKIIVSRSDNATIVEKGNDFKLEISNIEHSFAYYKTNFTSGWQDIKKVDSMQFIGLKKDGTYDYINDNITYSYSTNSSTGTITANMEAQNDYVKIIALYRYVPTNRIGVSGTYEYMTFSMLEQDTVGVTVSVSTEEAGLLKQIIQHIASIGYEIYNLPQKLWSLISEGLKSLFVPDPNYFKDYRREWGVLLSTRLGAVFESVQYGTQLINNLLTAGQVDIIELPRASINLPGGNSFAFGGWEIDIVPDKFNFIVTTLKIIIGIVATLGFMNGLAKKYDEVMGVEK